MRDYGVDDLDALLAKLSAAGVWVALKRQNESYGRFAWIQGAERRDRDRARRVCQG
jgi:hypothetical protein